MTKKTKTKSKTRSALTQKKGLFFAPALREAWALGYGRSELGADLIAGITVGIIAVPLAMALAIASGVPPQQGLYTAIIAGAIIAIFGGSRLGIAGPTAAFVVLLQPISAEYGLEGLLVATIIAGVFQLLLGISRLGYLVQFIPYPVTTGFTAGIGVVIAVLQLKDLAGLDIHFMPETFIDKIQTLYFHLPTWKIPDTILGVCTLIFLFAWKKTSFKLPGHLPALLLSTMFALLWAHWDPSLHLDTLGTRFHYDWNGQTFPGIPPFLPSPHWPDLTWDNISNLIKPALGLALLGAIESLLCAVVADGFSGTKHFPNSELIAQGLGNIVAPFFGGITATNAIARTTVNIKSGAKSPLAALFHAITVLLCMVLFAKYLSWIPMSALAAVLIFVAYQMADIKHFKRVMVMAPRSDKMVLWVCFLLTVFFDMVLAVGVGMILASFLFMRRMVVISGSSLADHKVLDIPRDVPQYVKIYQIHGPLFFGAAEKAIDHLRLSDPGTQMLILVMKEVPTIDMTAFVALESLLAELKNQHVGVVLCGLSARLKVRLQRLGLKTDSSIQFADRIDQALDQTDQYLATQAGIKDARRSDEINGL